MPSPLQLPCICILHDCVIALTFHFILTLLPLVSVDEVIQIPVVIGQQLEPLHKAAATVDNALRSTF